MKTKSKKILLPKCPYCGDVEFTWDVQYIEDEFCEVNVVCAECGETYAITFECTMITKLDDDGHYEEE